MPCLDAAALSIDVEGMEFLRDILDAPINPVVPAGAFRRPVSQIVLDEESARRHCFELVPEPA